MRRFVERVIEKYVPQNEVAHVLHSPHKAGHTTKEPLRRFDNAKA